MRDRTWKRVASHGLAYAGLGVGSAVISNDLGSAPLQAAIRVGILLVAVAVFHRHLRSELARSAGRLVPPALVTASALASGTFLLAVFAVGMSWKDSPSVPSSLLWALPAWPVATGLPAFAGAIVFGRWIAGSRARTASPERGGDAA